MENYELVEYCGTNAMRWAEEFCKIAREKGIDLGDDPEGWLVGWFACALCNQEEEERAKRERIAIETLGLMSAVLADASGAWDGLAPRWFPEPPEWLELWQECEAVVTADPDAPDQPSITYITMDFNDADTALDFLRRLEAING